MDDGRDDHLSRPKRFGKSALISTLKALFEGKESVFKGLDIHQPWNWLVPPPVVRISFGGMHHEPDGIEGDIIEHLESVERQYELRPAFASDPGPRRLRNL